MLVYVLITRVIRHENSSPHSYRHVFKPALILLDLRLHRYLWCDMIYTVMVRRKTHIPKPYLKICTVTVNPAVNGSSFVSDPTCWAVWRVWCSLLAPLTLMDIDLGNPGCSYLKHIKLKLFLGSWYLRFTEKCVSQLLETCLQTCKNERMDTYGWKVLQVDGGTYVV